MKFYVYKRLHACFLKVMEDFLKVVMSYPKVVEGCRKVAERLFRNVLSKRLGTQNFYCEKKVSKR